STLAQLYTLCLHDALPICGQLTFRAPNSKVPRVGPDASVEERITYVLQSEINPGLAGHGGNCALVEVKEDPEHGLTAVLKFGGGDRKSTRLNSSHVKSSYA